MDDVVFYLYERSQGPMLLRKWNGDPWLFYKGAEDQWVSLRKASVDDLWKIASTLGNDYEVFDFERMEKDRVE